MYEDDEDDDMIARKSALSSMADHIGVYEDDSDGEDEDKLRDVAAVGDMEYKRKKKKGGGGGGGMGGGMMGGGGGMDIGSMAGSFGGM